MATQGTMQGEREYLKVMITRYNGDIAWESLRLSDVRKLNDILKHCHTATVERSVMSLDRYKTLFGR